MTETKVRHALVEKLRSANCVAQPIESGVTGVGIPDLFVRTCKVDCWCEVKIAKPNKDWTWVRINWRPGQLRWIGEYVAHGGKVLLAVGFESKQGEALALFEYPNFLQVYAGDDFSGLARKVGELRPFEGKRLVSIIDNL